MNTPKNCYRCKSTKDTCEFNKQRGAYDGLQGYCRDCQKEHERLKTLKYKELTTPDDYEKVCNKCNILKPKSGYHKDSSKKDGLHTHCNECRKCAALQSMYGITMKDKESIYAEQDGLCGICQEGVPFDLMVVDHCHTTGEVRGLLCNPCNLFIGIAKDDIQTLANAIKYLDKNNGK